jgi:hypothetical protein
MFRRYADLQDNGNRKRTVRAWVTFIDTGAAASIRDSYNVSSVTRNGTGDYTINWARPFGYAAGATGYAVVGTCRPNTGVGAVQFQPVDGAGMYANTFVKVITGSVGVAAVNADVCSIGAWGP